MRKFVILFILSGCLIFLFSERGISANPKTKSRSIPPPVSQTVTAKSDSSTSIHKSPTSINGLFVAVDSSQFPKRELSPAQKEINELARQHKEILKQGGDISAIEARIREAQNETRNRPNALDQGTDACPGTLISNVCLPYTITGTTSGMSNDYTPACNANSSAPDVVYEFIPEITGTFTISLCGTGSGFDTQLDIRTGGTCPGDYLYTCNDDYCATQSQVTVELTQGESYYIIIDGYSNSYGDYILTISGPNGMWEDCLNPGGFVVPMTGWNTTCSFCNDLDYACLWSSTSPDEVFAYTPTRNMSVSFSLCRSSYDTKLYIYDGSCDGTPIACNDDASPCPCSPGAYRSFIECLQLIAGHTYYAVVDGFSGACGYFYLETEECPPCVVTSEAGDIIEQEEDCTEEGINQIDPNGGCAMTPHRFGSIADGQTVFGRVFNGWAVNSEVDHDWYILNLSSQSDITITVNTETDLLVEIGDSSSCTAIQSYVVSASCYPQVFEAPCVRHGNLLHVSLPPDANVPIPRYYRVGITANPHCCVSDVLYADIEDPISVYGFTSGAGNDCPMLPSEDVVIQVVIPANGWWDFDLCNSDFAARLYLDTVCCGASIAPINTCSGLYNSKDCISLIAGTYYATIEGLWGEAEYYVLTVSQGSPAETVTGVNASDTLCDGVLVTWQDVSNEIGYLIFRNDVYIGSADANDIIYWDSLVSPGTYGYKIWAANYCAASLSEPDSGTRRAPLPTVTGLTASDSSCDYVYLLWNDIAGEDGYVIYRDGNPIGQTPADITHYVDTPFVEIYNYNVVGFTTYGISCGLSNTAQGRRFPTLWEPPVLLAPAEGAQVISGDFQLYAWDIMPTATMYNIEWDDDEWFNTPISMSSPSPTVTATITAPNGIWYWHVQGVNKCGSSPWNLTRYFYLINFPAPQLVIIRNGAQLQLFWNRIALATSYQVESATTPDGPFSFMTSTTDTTVNTSFAGADRMYYRVLAVRDVYSK